MFTRLRLHLHLNQRWSWMKLPRLASRTSWIQPQKKMDLTFKGLMASELLSMHAYALRRPNWMCRKFVWSRNLQQSCRARDLAAWEFGYIGAFQFANYCSAQDLDCLPLAAHLLRTKRLKQISDWSYQYKITWSFLKFVKRQICYVACHEKVAACPFWRVVTRRPLSLPPHS